MIQRSRGASATMKVRNCSSDSGNNKSQKYGSSKRCSVSKCKDMAFKRGYCGQHFRQHIREFKSKQQVLGFQTTKLSNSSTPSSASSFSSTTRRVTVGNSGKNGSLRSRVAARRKLGQHTGLHNTTMRTKTKRIDLAYMKTLTDNATMRPTSSIEQQASQAAAASRREKIGTDRRRRKSRSRLKSSRTSSLRQCCIAECKDFARKRGYCATHFQEHVGSLHLEKEHTDSASTSNTNDNDDIKQSNDKSKQNKQAARNRNRSWRSINKKRHKNKSLGRRMLQGNSTVLATNTMRPASTAEILVNRAGSSSTLALFQKLATRVPSFYQDVLHLYQCDINRLDGKQSCTDESCPRMTAGPKYEFLHWTNGAYAQPTRVSANVYINDLFKWIEEQVNDKCCFPDPQADSLPTYEGQQHMRQLSTIIKSDRSLSEDVHGIFDEPSIVSLIIGYAVQEHLYPPDFKHGCREICRRLFRVYGHMYHSHYQNFVEKDKISELDRKCCALWDFATRYQIIHNNDLLPLKDKVKQFNQWRQAAHAQAKKNSQQKQKQLAKRE